MKKPKFSDGNCAFTDTCLYMLAWVAMKAIDRPQPARFFGNFYWR